MTSRFEDIMIAGIGPAYDRLIAACDIQDNDDLAAVASELLRAIHAAMADPHDSGKTTLARDPAVRAIVDKLASLCRVQSVQIRSPDCPHRQLKLALDRRAG